VYYHAQLSLPSYCTSNIRWFVFEVMYVGWSHLFTLFQKSKRQDRKCLS
jgi:hypothetical protein